MKTVTSTDLKQSLGDVLAAAASEPVTITRHGTPRFVLMTLDELERQRAPYPRAYSVDNAPDDLTEMILSALDDRLSQAS
jgi:prevent-host-death family protein